MKGEGASTAVANVAKNTVYAWQISAGTGEGIMDADPTGGNRTAYLALGLPDSVPFFSSDNGSTWSKTPSFTITTKSVLLDPWISYDSQGSAYAGTYIGNTTHPYDWLYPYVAKSVDHGASFTLQPTSYSPPWTRWSMPDGTLKPSCGMAGPGAIDFPKIVADKSPTSPFHDNLYIVGSAGVNSTGSSFCAGLISFIRSQDGGLTWDMHRVLAGQDGQVIVRPNNLVVAPNGTIYFAVTYTGGGVLLVYSKDAGVTWSTKTIPLGFGTGEHWMAVSKVDSNDLYVAFERTLADNSVHIYMISSTTGGAAWSSPVRVDDILPNDTVDHSLPSMDVSQDGRVFVAWRDYRNTSTKMQSNSNTTDIYAYSSTVGSAGNIRISNATGRFCGPYSPCYRVAGNDYFTVLASFSTDYVAFSLDEDQNGWPEAYASTVTYTGADFTMNASPTGISLVTGSSGTSTISLTTVNGFTGAVNLAAIVSPVSGLTCTLAPASVTLGISGTSSLSCSGSVGAYSVTVTGSSGSLAHSATVTVTVSDYTVTASPTTVTILSGDTATSTIDVAPVSGFTGTVALTSTVSPAGLTCTLIPTSVVLGASQTSALSCTGTTANTFNVTVTGTSGSLSHYAVVTVTVQEFTITASPTSFSFESPGSGSSNITVSAVNGFSSVVSLTSSISPPVGLTCTLSPPSVTGSGTSTLNCSSSTPNTYTVTVTATGGLLSHSAAVTVTVTAPADFSVTVSPSSVTVLALATGISTITTAPINGFTGTVTLASSVSPTGLTCTPSPSSIVLGASQTSTLSCSGPAGTYTVTITGTSGSISHSTTITFAVQDFTISASPTSVAIDVGGTGTSTITIGPVNGFTGTVALSTSVSPPSGLACTLSPNSVTSGSGTSSLSCISSTSGIFTLTIIGTSATLTRTTTVSYNVAAPDIAVSASPTSVIVLAGATENSTITVAPVSGYTGVIALTSTVSPAGLTCTLTPATIVLGPSQTSILSCNGLAGSYTVAITGTDGSLSHSATLTVTVQDYTLTANPTNVSVKEGATGTSKITVASVNGFTGTVALTLSVAPSGLTCRLTQISILLGASQTSTLQCSGAAGNYTVTVTGTSGSLTRSATINYSSHLPHTFLLGVYTPSPGVSVTIDGWTWVSNASGLVSLQVENGTHTVLVQSMIPITIGPVYLPIGIANTFAVWGDGNTDNPRTVSISQDTVLTPTYRTSIQTSLYEVTIGTIAFFLLPLIALHHKRKRTQSQKTDGSRASATEVSEEDSAQSEIPSPRRETL